jgi:hypothetical protein
VYGGDVVISTFWPVPADADRAALEVRIARHVHFRVELVSQPGLGDRIEVFGASDERLPIAAGFGGGMYFMQEARLSAGRTAVLSVAETARTLVLYSGTEEVLRVPLVLTPGEVSPVRL